MGMFRATEPRNDGKKPAAAAASCSWVDYDQSNGLAVGECGGTGYMRFAVTCNAVWPYTSWTQRSDWIYIPGGLNPAASFPTCPWPASYSVWAEYL